MRILNAVVLVVLSIAGPARAATFDLTFNNNSTLITGPKIVSDASFDPITLFNGDTLSIVFNNVPTPTYFPQFGPGTDLNTILYGLGGGGVFDEAVVISRDSLGGNFNFGPLKTSEYGSSFIASAHAVGLHYGPTWTISLLLLSGEPPTSSVTVR